jgi:two-component system sensor histidine kinase AlgZ
LPDLCKGSAVLRLVLVTELLVLTMMVAVSGIRAFDWEGFALLSLFVLWIVLSSAALLCSLRKFLARLGLQWAVTAVFVLILAVTAVFSLLADWVLAGGSLHNTRFEVDEYGLLRNLLVSAVMTGLVLRYFYVQAQLRRQEQAELRSRILALQSRINPHFLFNSMNSIASLIATQPETAEKAVEDLCELFRASLRDSAESVPLQQELELCRRYLAIERLRLGDRLHVEWQVAELPEQARIPLLTLQPVLENAVYHGVQPLPEGGLILVVIAADTETVRIKVVNPMPQAGVRRDSGNGHRMALANIRDRLAALYGERAAVEQLSENDRFVTRISLPC